MLVSQLVAQLRAAPPRAGQTRVLVVDGRSGSGKSTLASRLCNELAAPLITMEDLYDGWYGLDRGASLLVSMVLKPLAAGQQALIPQYDWINAQWREPVVMNPPPVLVIEGAGAGAYSADYVSVLVWMEASAHVRKKRVLARGDKTFPQYWDSWAAQEEELLTREHIQERASVVISTEQGFAW